MLYSSNPYPIHTITPSAGQVNMEKAAMVDEKQALLRRISEMDRTGYHTPSHLYTIYHSVSCHIPYHIVLYYIMQSLYYIISYLINAID